MSAQRDNPHADLDATILRFIEATAPAPFATILAGVRAVRRGICPERLCEQRIQVLRRARKIIYNGPRKGWSIRLSQPI